MIINCQIDELIELIVLNSSVQSNAEQIKLRSGETHQTQFIAPGVDVYSQSNYNSTHFMKPNTCYGSVPGGGSAPRQPNNLENTGEFQMSFGVLRQSKNNPFSFQKDSAQPANEVEMGGNMLQDVGAIQPFNEHHSAQTSHRDNLLGAACIGLDSNFDTTNMLRPLMYSSCGTPEPQSLSKPPHDINSARSVSFNLSLSHRDTQRDGDLAIDNNCPYGSEENEVIEIEVARNNLVEVESTRKHHQPRRKSCTDYFKQRSDSLKEDKSPRAADNTYSEEGYVMTDRANSSVHNQSSFAFILSQDKDEMEQSSFCQELANFSKKLAAAEASQLKQNAKLEVQLEILKDSEPQTSVNAKRAIRMPLVTHLPSIHEVSNEDISFMRESVNSSSDRQHMPLKNNSKQHLGGSKPMFDVASRYGKSNNNSSGFDFTKPASPLSISRYPSNPSKPAKCPEPVPTKSSHLYSVTSRSTQQEEWNKENLGDLNLLQSAGTDRKSLDILRSVSDPHVVSTESKRIEIDHFVNFHATEDSVQYDEEHKFSMGSFVNLSMDA